MSTLQKNEKTANRVLYLDYLRILATLFVMLIHISAQNLDYVEPGSYAWYAFQVVNNAARWAVPMFVMLTGALFLDPAKQISVKNLYRKNIFRMVTAFAFWSALYVLDRVLHGLDLSSAKTAFLKGHYHMWYFHLVIGLYIITPVVRKITETKAVSGYFLVMAIVFVIILPEGIATLRGMEIPHTATILSAINSNLGGMNFPFPKVFLIYFVMGSYLYHYDLPGWLRKTVYVLGVAAYLSSVLDLEQLSGGVISRFFPFGELYVNTSMSAAVFLFGKQVLSRIHLSEKWEKAVCGFSGCTFGMYLVHPMVLDKLRDVAGLNTLSFDPIVSMVVITVLVMGISAVLSFGLHRIPLLKKYVV